MAFCKYNTEETASAVFEKLVPEFSKLSKDLSEISQFIDRLQINSDAPSSIGDIENPSPEKESDFEKIKQELDSCLLEQAEVKRLLKDAESKRDELGLELDRIKNNPEVNPTGLEERLKTCLFERNESEGKLKALEAKLRAFENLEPQYSSSSPNQNQVTEESAATQGDVQLQSSPPSVDFQRDNDEPNQKVEKLKQQIQLENKRTQSCQDEVTQLQDALQTEKESKESSLLAAQNRQKELEQRIGVLTQQFKDEQKDVEFAQAQIKKLQETNEAEKYLSQTSLNEEKIKIEKLQAQMNESQKKATDDLNDSSKKYGLIVEDRDALKRRVAEMQQRIEIDVKLESMMWPEFLNTPEMKIWKELVESAVHEEKTDANAVILVANLFNYNSLVDMDDTWHRRLFDVLHDFSRALFGWCGSLSYDREQSVVEARKWASKFNDKGVGVFKIEVPEPDEPFDTRVMVSYTKGGSSSLDVKDVKTWCIKDNSGRILKQAEVTTC